MAYRGGVAYRNKLIGMMGAWLMRGCGSWDIGMQRGVA